MVDLLAEQHHVYKSPEKAQALCEKLRNNPTVWGYTRHSPSLDAEARSHFKPASRPTGSDGVARPDDGRKEDESGE
jgi:hypothetical protein